MKNRKILIAGNWKMNKNNEETRTFFSQLKKSLKKTSCDIIFCVPFLDIKTSLEETKDCDIKISAQNCHFKEKGAYTGEISVGMLKEVGVDFVLLGHSERRQYFNETDYSVNLKIKAALKEGLCVIFCVGETLDQRKNDVTDETIAIQLKKGLKNVSKEEILNVVVAYEPVWAIGTGENASSSQAQDVCKKIRNVLAKIYDEETAEKISILYGGSMKPENCEELLKQEDIDGGLIGGASLSVEDFSSIVEKAESL